MFTTAYRETVTTVLVTILLFGSSALGAGAVAAQEGGNFDVEILETNAPITEGETLVVTAHVENTGSAEDSQQIHLKSPDSQILDSVDHPPLTLAPGESERVTLEWDTGAGDAGTGNFSVQSNDDYPTVLVEIREGSGDVTPTDPGGGDDEPADAGSSDTSGDSSSDFPETTVSVENSANGWTASIEELSLSEPSVTVPLEATPRDGVTITEVAATFERGTTLTNELHVATNRSAPGNLSAPPDFRVLGFVSLDVDGSLADDMTEGSFTVELDRTNETDVAPENLTALVARNGEWQTVDTRVVNNSTVEVVSDDFSVFAIGTPAQVEPTPTETATPTPTATATETPQTPAPPEPTEEPRTSTESGTTGSIGPGFGPLVAVLGLVGAALLGLRRLA